MPSTEKSIWRGVTLGTEGALKLSTAAVDAEATTTGDLLLSGLPRTADGSLAVELPEIIPDPPVSGTFVLTATDGVLSWEAAGE